MEITRSMEEREKEFGRLVFHLPEAEAALRSKKNVVDIGIACKEIAGRHIETMCYVVYVQEKTSAAALGPADLIPEEIAGIPTDVVEIRSAKFLEDKAQYRPLKGGIQVASNNGSWVGTLGCFAVSNENSKLVMLSNHHVLYHGDETDGDPVGQPDLTCSACCTCDIVAYNMKGVLTNKVDGAIARIGIEQIADNYVISNVVKGLGEYTNVNTASEQLTNDDAPIYGVAPQMSWFKSDGTVVSCTVIPGQRVRKVGRTTGRTIGKVIGIAAPGRVGIPQDQPPNFLDQIYIVPHTQNGNNQFAQGGDSGSVIVNDHNQVVGLLMASKEGNDTYDGNYANNIHNVMEALNIRIYGTPKAVITFTPQGDNAAPFTASFSGAQSVNKDGEIISYAWDLGDPDVSGLMATQQGVAITHTFNLPGTYYVTLTVTNSVGASHRARLPVVVDYPAGGGGGGATFAKVQSNGNGYEQAVTQNAGQLSTQAWMNQLQESLEASETGKQVAAYIRQFRQEVLRLVNHNRKVTVVWQRKKGPAFIAQCIKALRTPGASLPVEVNGVHIQSLLQSMALVLEEEGSTELAQAIRQHQLRVFNLLDKHRTLEEILSAIHGSTVAPMIK